MFVSVLPVPFADAARQGQYEAVLAALRAETDAPATVLLGNLGAFSPVVADVLIVRPAALVLVVLTPRAGQLTIPALAYGTWQLDGQPLAGAAEADNPFAQYQAQLPIALSWLSEHLGLSAAELPPCAGIALFEAPLTFGPEVEARLHRHAATHDFQLAGGASQLPTRLRQFESAAGMLTENELLEWGEYLANTPYVAHEQGMPKSLFESPADFLAQKLRQLWRWLGAEDIPADPPYGSPPPADQHLRDQQEQARLRQLRQELQAELHQHRQEAALREAARTQELAALRQQLAQASPSATERQAEHQAKAALEEALRTARTELATRNQELDARIQQLGQLIQHLQTAAPAPATAPPTGLAALTKPTPRRAATPKRSFRRLRQAERWGLVALAWAGIGAGTWGVVRWAQRSAPQPAATVAQHRLPTGTPEGDLPPNASVPADSLARASAAVAVDTPTYPTTEATPTATETEPGTIIPGPAALDAFESTPVTTQTTEPASSTVSSPAPDPSPEPTEPETSPTP